jgi:type II restriction enzyme
LGGLIEEWLGVWAKKNNFNITDPKENGNSQEFPDYYIGDDKDLY